MSDDQRGKHDLYYIIGLVAAGLVILGLAGGLFAMAVGQRRRAAEVNKLRGIQSSLEMYKNAKITDANVKDKLQSIFELLGGILRGPQATI